MHLAIVLTKYAFSGGKDAVRALATYIITLSSRCLRHRLHHVCLPISDAMILSHSGEEVHRPPGARPVRLLISISSLMELIALQICGHTGSSILTRWLDFFQTQI